MRFPRWFHATLVLLLGLALLAGCNQETSVAPSASQASSEAVTESQPVSTPKEPAKVRVAEVIHSIFYAPQYVALHEGFFTDEGLDVELGVAWGADRGAAALVSGSADIGLFGPEAAVYILAQGSQDPVQAFAQLTKRDGSFLVGRPGSEVDFSWQHVRGQTIIGGRKGGVPEMVLEHTLRLNEIRPFEDVEILQNIALDATAAAFVGGTGDFVQLWEPGASAVARTGEGVIVASLGTDAGEVPYTVFHATKSYLDQNPEIVLAFAKAIYRAQQWVEEQPAQKTAEAIISEFPDTSIAELTDVIQRYKDLDIWMKDPLFQPESLDKLQSIMIEADELSEDQRQSHSDLVRTEFAQAVMNP